MEKSNYCPNMFYDTEQVSIGEFNTLQECMNFPIHNIWCINRDEDNLFEKYKSQGNRVLIICCWNRSDKWRFVVGIVKGGNVKYFDLNDLPMDLVQLDFESYLGRDAVAAIKGLNEQTIYNQQTNENRTMNKKQTIRLNEAQLKRVVTESVKRVLNENRLKRVIMESINEVLDGELDDDVVTVYHLCDRRTAIEAMNGNVSAMVSSGGTRFPGKILVTLEPREFRGVYGNTMLELQVPASSVNNVQHSRHDGDYCAIDPSDIYKVSIYR